jgi:hypothetical protein
MAQEPESSGGPIYPHDEAVPDDAPSGGDPRLIERVDAHIGKHIGPVDQVFHEMVSPYVHVDVHHVPPAADRPFHALVTSGMSELPMTTPPGAEAFQYAELIVLLPPAWPLSQEAFEDEANYWPVRWLKQLARLPHEFGTWLGYGHSIPNGDPPVPFAPTTKLSGMLLATAVSLPEAASELRLDDERSVFFWTVIPLYAEEMELKLRKGADALLDKLANAGITDIIDPTRPNVAVRRFWPF